MNIIENALWQVESNLRRPISLEAIAATSGVSPAYLTRVFATVTGQSLMRYARARRLTVAARVLALGVPDILGLALDVGYGSHEAFTRAFREHFGQTPESVRDARSLANLELTEPLIMDTTTDLKLAEPTLVARPPMLLAGLIKTYAVENIGAIPALWDQFSQMEAGIPDVVNGKVAYGASLSFSEEKGCEYMAAVEVHSLADLPGEFQSAKIPAATYAVFSQPGHITLMRSTIMAIWDQWLPQSGYIAAESALIEFYPSSFDPVSGNGGYEVWMPVTKK